MCATWIHDVLEYKGSIRISTGSWNTMDEMKQVLIIIKKIIEER
jgi:selenocysteine lyase/cysteine desulfurase